MSFGALSNLSDAIFDSCEKPIAQNASAFRFVVLQRSADVPGNQPVECQFHNLSTNFGFYFIPVHSRFWNGPHLGKAAGGFFGAVIKV
ncbi:MAG: hypothetical protein AAF236_04330 [Verrucomicrobiota bacterium]